MEVKVTVNRGTADGLPKQSTYVIDAPEDASVMDALLQVRDEQDPTLAFRASCGRGLCGTCAYRVNGSGVLTCLTLLKSAAKQGEVKVDPIRHVTVVRDLVYDMDTFLWDKLKAVTPAVVPASNGAQEREIDQKVVDDLQTTMSCVMCGLCDEGCTVIAVDKTFLGPAALTQAYRAVADPRDTRLKERLKLLDGNHGVWDCTHCFEANSHCPKGINPTDRIIRTRDLILKHGTNNAPVRRHHDSFAASVRTSGWLDEGRLAVESAGWTNIPGLLRLLPTAWKAMLRGKAPIPYLHRKRPGAEQIRRIMTKAERNRQ